MGHYGLTTASLEHWLRQREYTIQPVRLTAREVADANLKAMEKNNRVLGRSFHHTFDKWYKQFKRIPTPQEFMALQLKDIRANFSNTAWKRNNNIKFTWTDTVEKGIKNRILRSYKSFIIELHTELLISELFPKYQIMRDGELDYSGIDLLVKDRKNKVDHFLHITKNGEYAIDYLFKKEGRSLEFRGYGESLWARPEWKKSNHAIYSNRSFTGHTFLLYDESGKGCGSCKLVNGYPLFTDEYIKYKLEVNKTLRAGA